MYKKARLPLLMLRLRHDSEQRGQRLLGGVLLSRLFKVDIQLCFSGFWQPLEQQRGFEAPSFSANLTSTCVSLPRGRGARVLPPSGSHTRAPPPSCSSLLLLFGVCI
ncbi:hypothetical protein E2C01_097600 [Portunus trituberculatus]|uniref:Uncharacterized protein n=1 Tax=Portunus trituberculatus TaxID=210409 RepID=A0A5B7KBU1_PORTR|nr:hypothetical protein [Portunus trituberculatus]